MIHNHGNRYTLNISHLVHRTRPTIPVFAGWARFGKVAKVHLFTNNRAVCGNRIVAPPDTTFSRWKPRKNACLNCLKKVA